MVTVQATPLQLVYWCSMLRHTGTLCQPKAVTENNEFHRSRRPRFQRIPLLQRVRAEESNLYTLYMRENYVTLKKKCNDDKKAIFSMPRIVGE
jgi:hypothetical protein